MKSSIFAAAVLVLSAAGFSAQGATTYYCKLENAPAVQKALAKGLVDVQAAQNGVVVTGSPQQIPVTSFGDAFDFWASDILAYSLDGIAKDNRRSVGVKVTYYGLAAKDYIESERAGGGQVDDIVCSDTSEVNAEKVYIEDAEGDFPITAEPLLF